MFVTFYSNFLNAHQIPFCNAMYRLLDGNFRFVATTPMDQERLKMKFEDKKYPYEVRIYESELAQQEAIRLAMESDVVIRGDAPFTLIEPRLKADKLTFRYTERYFKQGRWRILDPRVLIRHFKEDFKYRNNPYYLLCASAYTAPDCRFIYSYPDKAFKWGYFPEVREYDVNELIGNKKKNDSMLWVGRMIDWKHPLMAVKAARKLKGKGVNFHLTMIGEGPEREKIEDKIEEWGLKEFVTIKNFMPQDQVRRHMEEADIFLFTSDRQEGWGAVLNEAMNSGCAVVANDEIGSVPFLIEHGKNGLIYHKTEDSLIEQLESLMTDQNKIERLGKNAYATMREVWNAESAAQRLIELIKNLQQGKTESPFAFGPCSKAFF